MAPLATAFVRVRPQISEAEVRTSAARAGEQAGVAMGRSMSTGLSRTFKAAAGIGAATGLVEVGRKVFELADQFEGARARVEQNAQNIGAAFDSVEKPLGALDDKMAAFGFTVTDTENSFAQLVTATRDPAKALRDVALAADVARGRHESLDSATQTLMKVETGHVAMLGRLGIQTRDANGNLFTQQQAIDAITKAYQGNAAAFAATSPGKQAAAIAEISKSGAEIGVALLPALVDVANVLAHDVLPPIADFSRLLDRNRHTIEPLAKALLISVAAWKSYVIWTRLAAASNALFARSAVGAAAGAASAAGAARLAGGAAATGSAGAALGTGMATGLTGANVTLANSALMAARNIGLMGLSTLGIVNFIKNPRSLGFPMGFNTDAGVGRNKVVGGAPARYFDKQGNAFSDPDLKHAITDTNTLTAATRSLNGAEVTLGANMQRTATQLEGHVQHALALRSAQDGLRSAMHAAAQTAVDSGRALAGNSDAALANRDAVRAEVTQIFAVIDAMKTRGATDAAQANMLDVLTQAVETNAIKTYGDKAAVDALLTSLGLIPGKALAAANAMAAINTAVASDKAISPSMVKAATASSQAATSAGAKIAASFNTGFSPVVAKGAASAGKKAATAFADQYKTDLQTLRDSIASITSSVAGFADFSTSGTDSLGASGLNTDVAGQLKAKASQLEQFARLFNQLDHDGLDPHLMAQFAQIGPDAIPAMQALVGGGRRGIRQVNAIEGRINRAAGQVAREETGMANSGLIHKDLTTLPAKLAREFARELRALKIVTDVRGLDRRAGKAIFTLA